MTRPLKLLYFVTEDWYFCSHRLPLAVAARQAGYDVSVVTRVQEHGEVIRGAGLRLIPLALDRSGKNPVGELRTLRQVTRIYRNVRPDIVHHVALKPVLYGSIAARFARVPVVINALMGLGYLFSSADLAAKLIRPCVEMGLRGLLGRSRLIVQNPDDRQLILDKRLSTAERVALIRGSGVDLAKFAPMPEPTGIPLVVLPARLLWDKGIREFVDAARQLRRQGVQARFALVGEPDVSNPAAVPPDMLQAWSTEGAIELWGWRTDMAEVLAQAHIVCLPSYREGLPKALLEAAACGRPLVSCDVPGCREIVQHGVNGLLVAPRDAAALAAALHQLLQDAKQRTEFGRQGRRLVAAEFSVESVIAQTLALYRECASS